MEIYKINLLKYCFVIPFWLIVGVVSTHGQSFLSGYVLNEDSIALTGSHIQIENTAFGTVSNQDGIYILNIPATLIKSKLIISHLGHKTKKMTIDSLLSFESPVIVLEENFLTLDEVSIYPENFASKVLESSAKIEATNYVQTEFKLDVFYRQLIKQDSTYVRLSDAFIEVYQPKYNIAKNKERSVKIIEARQTNNYLKDIKYFSPPSLILKHIRPVGFNDLFYKSHSLEISETVLNDREVYVIKAIPKINQIVFLYETVFYVDKLSYSIMGYDAILLKRNISHLPIQNINIIYEGKRVKALSRKVYEKGGQSNFIFEKKVFNRYVYNEAIFEIMDSRGNMLTTITDNASIVIYNIDNDVKQLGSYKKGRVNYFKEFPSTTPYNVKFWNENSILEYSIIEKKVKEDLEKKHTLNTQFNK